MRSLFLALALIAAVGAVDAAQMATEGYVDSKVTAAVDAKRDYNDYSAWKLADEWHVSKIDRIVVRKDGAQFTVLDVVKSTAYTNQEQDFVVYCSDGDWSFYTSSALKRIDTANIPATCTAGATTYTFIPQKGCGSLATTSDMDPLASRLSEVSQAITNYTDAAIEASRPSINSIPLVGNKTASDLKLLGASKDDDGTKVTLLPGTSYLCVDGPVMVKSDDSAYSSLATWSALSSAIDGHDTSTMAHQNLIGNLVNGFNDSLAGKENTIDDLDAIRAGAAAGATALETASRVLAFVYGSNTVITVTNYDWQITGKLPHFSIEDRTDPENPIKVYDSTLEHADTLQQAKTYSESLYTDPAWSQYASGTGQAAPEGTTWISTPQTVLAGNLEFSKRATTAGAVWVLTYTGIVGTQEATTDGFMTIAAMDGTTAFTFRKGSSYTIGCDAGSIIVNGNTVTISYTVAGLSAHPTIKASRTIDKATRNFTDLSDLSITESWTQSADTWTATLTVPGGMTQCFFMAEASVEGANIIEMEAPMSGWIMCSDGIHKCRPVYSGGSVTWEVR